MKRIRTAIVPLNTKLVMTTLAAVAGEMVAAVAAVVQ
jgi:hypothetical protein